MAKGQRSTREKRKPKTDKPKPSAQASPFGRAPGQDAASQKGGKKGR
jgi:hypothetical protein